jgi:TonB-linked SusC/RagA family outer membrane protein
MLKNLIIKSHITMIKKYIPLLITMLFLCSFTWNAFGQRKQQVRSITVEAVVVDDSGIPVPNAVITGKEGAIEVLSDENGRFSIEVPENSPLLFEAKGFDSKTISSSLVSQNMTLNRSTLFMDDASTVNIPFGKIKRRETVGAMTVINTDDIIKYDHARSLYDIINARVPGLIGNTNLRGMGGIVFIVDGMPRDPSKLSMEEIDQVTVLKDANSAMLYGASGARGIVLVTTKRGEPYKRRININVEQGISTPISLPKYLNSSEYMTLYNEALANDGLPSAFADTIIDRYASGINPYRYPSVDYYSSDFLKSSRPFSKYQAEFSGGNESTQFYANVGWLRSGTLYELGEYKFSENRFNVRTNVNVQINDYVKGYVDAVAVFDVNKYPNGNFWSYSTTLLPHYFSPLLPASSVKSNATYTGGASLLTAKYYNNQYLLGGTSQYTNNIYGNMERGGYNQPVERNIQLNNGFEIDLRELTQGLKLKTSLNFDLWNAYALNVTNTYAVYAPTWTTYATGDSISALQMIGTDTKTGVQNMPTGTTADPIMNFNRNAGLNASLDYTRTFNSVHSINAVLLAYYHQYKLDGILEPQNTAHIGLALRYDYEKKYFVDLTSAYSNGYKLAPGNKGGFSPSIGLAWVISEEDFLSGSNSVNYLKLRASAGITNYEFSANNYRLYEAIYANSTGYNWNDGLNSRTSAIPTRSANPDLTFEKMKSINIGFEGYFFDNLLYLDANLFSIRNTGQVIQRRNFYSSMIYNDLPYENYNETGYSGAELGLVLSRKVGDVSFDFGVNTLYATSKVLKRDELWLNDYQYREGLPNDAIFGLEAIGLFADQADIDNSPFQMFGVVKPGDIKYKDQNDDGYIDSDDQIEIGNSQPRFNYGLHLTLRYKDLSFFAIGNGTMGSDAYWSGSYFWVQGTGKYSEEVLNRWTPATSATADYPRLSSGNNPNNFQGSTFWMYNENYFSLNRVQLTYELPRDIAGKLSSKHINVYLRGSNLLMLAKDAEKRQLRVGTEPLYRNYALGISLMF